MRAGFASADVTPPIGVSLCGFGHGRLSTAIRDELQVRALALIDSGGTPAVLVSTDVLAMTPEQIQALRDRVRDSVDSRLLVINHSHTHAGPSIGILRDHDLAGEEYVEFLLNHAEEAIRGALDNARPATLSVGFSQCDVGTNRRLPVPGGIALAPNPGGPCDREVAVFKVDDEDSREPIACWFRAAIHPVTLGSADTRISADWPGEVSRLLAETLAPAGVLFAQGCCGDVNPRTRDDEDALAVVALGVVDAVRRAWEAAEPIEPLLRWRAARAVRSLSTVQPSDPADLNVDFEAQAVVFAEDLQVVGLNCEPFTRINGYLAEAVPNVGAIVTLGYTNGCFGYLPDREAFEDEPGKRGYEIDGAPWWYRTALLAPESVDEAMAHIATVIRTARKTL